MEEFLFWIYALAACGGAISVVLTQNVVRMAFSLVISLGSVAGLFFLLNADFVGATQLLIYVGGTVVLLIFGVMLTSSAPFQSIQSTPGEVLQGAVVGLAFLVLLVSSVVGVDWKSHEQTLATVAGQNLEIGDGFNPEGEGNTARPIGTALLGMRFDRDLRQETHAAAEHAGTDDHRHGPAPAHAPAEHAVPRSNTESKLSTGYLLPFEIVSVHLLVVLIGAAYLARAKRRAQTEAV